MKRLYRLTHSADFARLRKQGQSWAHPLLILSMDRNDLEWSRFGFIVSRRIGKAVVRNRVKRQLREAIRHHLEEFPRGWDVVIIARAPIAEARFAEIENAVMRMLARARSWACARERGAAVQE